MEQTDTLLILARLEVKLDQLLTVSGDHEVRLRRLEARRWPLPVASTAMALAALGVSVAPLVVIK